MKKHKRFIATVSMAALLAVGASMTSFADTDFITGWQEENGEWFYYNKGIKVQDGWAKDGSRWYWLDPERGGAMATDKIIEDGDDIYYVDFDGAMVTNDWVSVPNQEQDDEDDPAEYNYYYLQGNGKAFKGNGTTTRFKTIDGWRYAFDEDGKRLYGWVDGDGSRLTGEDGWATVDESIYYLGDWDDGAMKTGWQKILVYDEIEDADMEHWFYFKSNGKRFYNNGTDNMKEKKINGKTYGFDARGVMVYEWTLATGSNASVSSWKYFNDPQDGVRVTKGWFNVVAATEENSFGDAIENIGTKENPNTFDYTNADEGNEKWYYGDDKGKLKAGEIARIGNNYYGFAPEGYMLDGLVFMSVDEEGQISYLYDDDVDADDLDDIMNGTDDYVDFGDEDASLYYFGSGGAMKTGPATIKIEDESHKFLFSKTGGVEGKGKGVSGIKDGKYIYKYGKKLEAGDDKYRAVSVLDSESVNSGLSGIDVTRIESAELRASVADYGFYNYKNKDDDTVRGLIFFEEDRDLYLINASGTIVKDKNAAKDGDDWYFFVQDKRIRMYLNNKTLVPKKDKDGDNVNDFDLSDWKNQEYGFVSPE